MKNKKQTNTRNLGFDLDDNDEEEIKEVKTKTKSKSSKQSKAKSGKNGKQKNQFSIPKTVQDTIPYLHFYKNGIIELDPGIFSKSYKLEDVNFKIATDEEQMNIFQRYEDLLNTFDSEIKLQLVIFNRSMNDDRVREKVKIPYRKDNLNPYREEYNNMLLDKMKEGRNNITKEKYMSVTINAASVDEAFVKFTKLDSEMSTAIKRINGQETQPMTAVERLEVLADIYSDSDGMGNFYKKAKINDKNIESFSFESMAKQGLTTKDLIGPASIKVGRDYLEIGDKFSSTLFIDNLPTFMNANILEELTDVGFNMLVSISYNRLKADKAMSLLKNQMVNINGNVVDAQKRAAKAGYSPDLISPELLRSQEEAKDLMDDITTRNQSLILTTFTITVFGDTQDELEKNIDQLKSITGKFLFQIKKLNLY